MSGYYGNPWQTDGLNNQQIGGANAFKLAIRDRSQHTGTLLSIDLYRKSDGAASSSGYWNGTGGSWLVRCETDNAGVPSGTLLSAGASVTAATPGPTSLAQRFTFGSSIPDILSVLRYFVITNADASPVANFASCNCMDINDIFPTPLQPTYLDADRACLQSTGGAFAIDRNRYPIFALNYADGSVYGVSYYDALSGSGQRSIGSLNKVRQNFTPSGDQIVNGAHFRVYKVTGTSAALVIALKDLTAGTTVASTSVPAASVHLGSTVSGYGARYVDWTFTNTLLKSGNNYSLELSSTESVNFYVSFPSRRGGSGFGASFSALDRFLDGNWEYTTDGVTWLQHSPGTTEQQAQAFFDVVDAIPQRRIGGWGSKSR